MRFKQLIFAVLALLLMGRVEGSGVEKATLLPTLNLVSGADTMPPVRIISLRNEKSDLHQIVIPQHLPKDWNPATIVDPSITGPAYLNVFEMIQGRVPGVWVSGSFNNYQIRVRGALGPPLVIVDGMPFYGRDDQQINDLLGSIPPADVDYIEVLKSIGRTAIYGPGAGNGVIIVHTKRGAM